MRVVQVTFGIYMSRAAQSGGRELPDTQQYWSCRLGNLGAEMGTRTARLPSKGGRCSGFSVT